MPFAIEGFSAISRNYISTGVASNFYPRLPFLSALAAFTLTRNKKKSLNIGRPEGDILTGKMIKPAEKLALPTMNSYQPRIQGYETNNTKSMGARDTNPTVANPTTRSHGQATQNAALFNRFEIKTPVLIWHVDKDRAARAGTEKGGAIAMAQIIEEATEIAYQDHVKQLNNLMWNGNPSNQAMDPWDQPAGILQALSATNVYGNVDRVTNAAWQAQVDGSLTSVDLNAIIDDTNVTKGIVDYNGRGCDLSITTKALYLQFKAQLIAQGPVGVRVLSDGLPGMAEIGVKQEVLLKDNTYIMYDASCPASNVLNLTMDTWKLFLMPNKNITVTPFVDLSDKSEGAKNADQAFIVTQAIFSNDNPFLNVRYTAIGT